MIKNVAILGSTGVIGKKTIDIISKNKKEFKIILLSTNTNVKKLIFQAKKFNVKNLIIADLNEFNKAKKKYKKYKFKLFNSFSVVDELFFKKKIFYTMVSIVGIDGLYPTLKMIKYSQNIGITNKESLICGWNLIQKKLNKFKTNFIPVDSEHFSIFSLIQNQKKDLIKKVFLTASGGPFLNLPSKNFSKITISDAVKHPNWIMGKKISVDSSTMMNKVFEVIEAKNIFEFSLKQLSILIHQKSYVHSLVQFKNGLVKIIAHNPDMSIPIINSIFNFNKKLSNFNVNIKHLNELSLAKVDYKKFPLVKILNLVPDKPSLYETALVCLNDYFVNKFLNKKITYKELIFYIKKYSKYKKFLVLKRKKPHTLKNIMQTRDYVCLKLNTLGI